jgi:hypothetical protein
VGGVADGPEQVRAMLGHLNVEDIAAEEIAAALACGRLEFTAAGLRTETQGSNWH